MQILASTYEIPGSANLATQERFKFQIPYLPIAAPARRIEGSKPTEVPAIETY